MSLIRMFMPVVNATKRCISLNIKNDCSPHLCQIISKCMINTFERIALQSVPTLPKRPLNSYMIFLNETSPQLLSSNPNLVMKDLMKLIGQKWKVLPENVKQEYIERSKHLRDEYKAEKTKIMKALTPNQLEQMRVANQIRVKNLSRRRLKIALKDLNYPNRPLSSFAFYIKEMFSETSFDSNRQPISVSFKKFSEKWKSLSDNEKTRYSDLAKHDKLRYIEQMENWKKELAKPENKDSLKNIVELRAKGYMTNGMILKGSAKPKPKKAAKKVKISKKKLKSATKSKLTKKAKKVKAKKTVTKKRALSKTKSSSNVEPKSKSAKSKTIKSESESD